MCKNQNVFSVRFLLNHFRIPGTELFFKDLGNGRQTGKKLEKEIVKISLFPHFRQMCEESRLF